MTRTAHLGCWRSRQHELGPRLVRSSTQGTEHGREALLESIQAKGKAFTPSIPGHEADPLHPTYLKEGEESHHLMTSAALPLDPVDQGLLGDGIP